MRVLIAPDAFKGSLSAGDAAGAIARGVRRARPDALTRLVPMADGGEGTLRCLVAATNGHVVDAPTHDPLGRALTGHYGVSGDGRTVVVELAVASGLPLLAPHERDPRVTSTHGTGELILHALRTQPQGAEVILCLGGSATNDGGSGLLRALGFRFLDETGRELPLGGAALAHLARVDTSAVEVAVRGARFRLACDVTHPLLGPRGASATFGPQKGADAQTVAELDAALSRYADVLARDAGARVHGLPGGGAAGGAAAGLVALLGARLEGGADLVAEAAGLTRALRDGPWDVVFTGEGRLDEQSAHGKVVSSVARLARAHRVPVVALAGSVDANLENLYALGLTAAFSVSAGPGTLEDAVRSTGARLEYTAQQLTRLYGAFGRPSAAQPTGEKEH